LISKAIRADGKWLVKKDSQLSKLQTQLPKRQAVDMDVEIQGEVFRLIALWSLKEKRHTYLITNFETSIIFNTRDKCPISPSLAS